ncbi:unnamed protein product, partial [Prorocentrum cordatum]
ASTASTGKQLSKQKLLMGFLVDPQLGDAFMEITQRLSFSETITRTAKWCTRKQALEVYSDSELDEMVANDKIE